MLILSIQHAISDVTVTEREKNVGTKSELEMQNEINYFIIYYYLLIY